MFTSTIAKRDNRSNANFSRALSGLVILGFVLVGMLLSGGNASAATSSTLNFQGRLATNTGGLVADGSYNIEFKLYDDALAGTNLWTENRTGGNTVTVRNGYFSVYLGEVTPFGASIPWDQELWLTMNVEADGEMSPRFKLTAVPYAFRAGAVVDAAGNAFTGDDLIQKAPASIQGVNSALAAIRLNQSGAGSLLQLQGDGSDVFTVSKTGATTLGAGITVGNSSSTTAGTIRWSGTDLEVYDGTQWVSLTSGSGGGGGTLTFDGFYAYDAAGNIDVSAGWTDITLDTEVKEDTPYTHGVDAATVTIGEDGWYEISYNLSAYTSSGGNNDASFAAKLQENTGAGFTDIPGSFSYDSVTTSPNDGSVAGTITRQFTAGDIVKMQAQRTNSTVTVLTRADSAGLTIRKFVEPTGGGGGGTAFEQNGNAFGTTAILGTTDANGLNIITNNSTALSFTSGGAATFTNGLTISSGGLAITGDITGTAGLTLASGGAGDLTLDSASGIIQLTADTLRRSSSGTTTIDLFDSGGGTTLSILNSDAGQVAGLSVEGGITAGSFSGDGSGLTTLNAGNLSSGTINDLRLSTNVARLDLNQTFTGTPTFSTGLVLGNSTSTTTGAVRWSGTDFEGYDGIQWVSLTSGGGGGGGGSPVAATFYDATGGATIASGVFSTINLDTTLENSDNTIVDVLNDVVTVTEDGYYEISYQVTTRLSSGTRSGFNAKLQLDTGGGFADVAGSQAYHYGRITTETQGTSAATVVLNLAAGDSIQLQGQGTTQSFTTIADATSLSIIKITEAAAGGGGGGGTAFEQSGNAFGATAVLGTTDANNLNFITNNSTALSLTTSNQAIFSGEILANGGITLGDSVGDGLTIVSGNVNLTNGLNFDSNTFVIDSSNNRIGVGTSTTTNLLTINDATTADALADVLLATSSTSNKGLVIQTSAGQSANALEIQSSTGNVLAGFDENGGLVLGLTTVTSSATASRSISFPDASGTVCLSGSASCGYIQFANGSFQTDASTANTIAINKTNATGNLVQLQRNGSPVFTVDNNGGLQIQSTQSTALDIRNAGGTSFFSVDTSTGVVRVGPSAADGTGVLFVLDTKNTAGDPTGTNGAQYYNSSLNKFRCFENGAWVDCINSTLTLRSFIDSTSDGLVDANNTDYWDTAAENNNTVPYLPVVQGSGKVVYGTVTIELTSSTNQDVEATARVIRGIGSAPTCGAGGEVSVGGLPGIFATNTGAIKSSTVTFVDNPTVTGTQNVFYTVCSDAATAGNLSANITRIRVTLQEVTNNN